MIARHDELRERARKLLMQVKHKESTTNGNVPQNNNGKTINSNKVSLFGLLYFFKAAAGSLFSLNIFL